MRLCFDIEANGLLDTITKVHCIVAIDVDTGQVFRFRPHQVIDGLRLLQSASQLIAHNGINYDIPALKKLYPWWSVDENVVYDTLVGSRLIYADVKTPDTSAIRRWRENKESGRTFKGYMLPPKLFGSHSLKAWGYRLGELKGEFAEETDWAEYSDDMLDYCVQDVRVTALLYHRQMLKDYSPQAVILEHQAAFVLSKMERNGFKFDVEKAEQLAAEIQIRRYNLESELKETFGTWYQANGITVPKRTVRYKDKLKGDMTQGAPYTKVKLIEFNPSSRKHIAKVLLERGWQPQEFTDSGEPKLDDTVLNKLNFPEAKQLADYFLVQKRLGQLADGGQAWLSHVTADGFVHGSINPCGAVTGRATHSNPNIAQVPSGRAEYGKQCRELFTVPDGWYLMGSDASGLELRCLGHFMSPFDGGVYGRECVEGDIHWVNTLALLFVPRGTARDKHNDFHELMRGKSKTWVYSFLYGGGNELLGYNAGGATEEEREAWIGSPKFAAQWQRYLDRGEVPTEERVLNSLKGGLLKAQFLANIPALKQLINRVQEAAKRGFIKGLDGRIMKVRSAHSALNLLLQGAGAIICKAWVVETDRLMKEAGYKSGFDGDYALNAWVHDEQQIACRTKEIAEHCGAISQQAMRNVQEKYKFRVQLDTDFSIGKSWLETH
ncbi:TPA: DNA polymerase [Photobacterium damselae]